jgi:hypothetical protein
MATKNYLDEPLTIYDIPNFKKFYNSYTQSKNLVDKTEIPYGINVVADDNGAASKRAGKAKYGVEVLSGHAVSGMGVLHNTTYNELIVSAGTHWYDHDGTSTNTALTGVTFTTDLDTEFCQAIDRLYGANGTDKLAYTTNGSTITEQTANGNVGKWPVYYNQRLYMTNTTFPDRIYYSNPYTIDLTQSPPAFATTNFGTFDTSLTPSTPATNKNAGYIILMPGGGVEITRLFQDNQGATDYLYAYTKQHGCWRIGTVAAANSDGSIAHTIAQIAPSASCPAGRSVGKVANDQWFYGGDNEYSYGEVAQFQNSRITVKSGRIRSEMTSIPATYKSKVASGFFQTKRYLAYTVGSFNDRMVIYDTRLNVYSTPIVGINASCFLEFIGADGGRRLLAGSSDPSDSFVYELEVGTDDVGTAISATFETKSTDCDRPGLKKYLAFIDVFYSMLYGQLTYEVFVDEVSSITGTIQLGTSLTVPSGAGTQVAGTFLAGQEYDSNTTFPDLQQNSFFPIDCGYSPGRNVSVRFTNNNTGEQFKINSLRFYFQEGEILDRS